MRTTGLRASTHILIFASDPDFPPSILISPECNFRVCLKGCPETNGLGVSLRRTRPSFRSRTFSLHASVLLTYKRRSPFSSTHAFTPMSPLPSGIEPLESLLGEFQTTLYASTACCPNAAVARALNSRNRFIINKKSPLSSRFPIGIITRNHATYQHSDILQHR